MTMVVSVVTAIESDIASIVSVLVSGAGHLKGSGMCAWQNLWMRLEHMVASY